MIRRISVDNSLVTSIEEYLSSHNIANRGIEDGDRNKQKIGLIGELVVAEYLTGERPLLSARIKGFDGGYDILYRGNKIDVKTMERRSYVKPNFVNNFYILQQAHDADVIVFCSYHSAAKLVEICGWLPKNELRKRGRYYEAGTKRIRSDGSSFTFRQSNYEVENKELDDIEALKNIQGKRNY